MKKRALSLLMAAALFVSVCSVSVQAEFEITTSESQGFEVTEEGVQSVELSKPEVETDAATDDKYADYEWYAVKVENEGFVKDEILLKMDGVWYFSTDQIEYYTDYRYDEEDKCFRENSVVKSGGFSKAIAIDTSNNTAFVRAYLQNLDNIYEYNDQLYYPIHQLLPLMECTCGADGDRLYIEHAQVSMVDALGSYVPDLVYYDASQEFDGKAWANMIMVGSAYLFDTVANSDNWKRIADATYVDYRAAAKDYLTQYEVYEDVMDFKNELTDQAKEGKAAVEKSEKLENKYDFMNMIHDMLEQAGNESDFYEFIPEDIWKEIDQWAGVAEVAGEALEAVADYTLMVKDHRDMLGAVYPKIKKDVNFTDRKYRALKSIYDGYGGSVLKAIWSETVEKLKENGFWNIVEGVTGKSLGLYELVADVGGNAVTEILKNLGIKASDDMALLNHHTIYTNEAKEKYTDLLQSGAYTQKKAEELRLTALMTMVSSKRCFEIIRDNNDLEKEVVSYCNNRIANIDEVLKKLYLAKETVMVDGIEYYQKAPDMFALQLSILNGIESEPPAPLSELEYFFRENYSKSDKMWLYDVAGNDGINELLVATAPDADGNIYFRVYGTYGENGEITMIWEESAGSVPGEGKAMYLMEDGYGNYAFLYYEPQTLRGKEDIINVFALQTWGGWIILRSESVKGEQRGKEVLAEVVDQFHQLNPYWIELFNNLRGSEDEGMQNALNGAGVEMGFPNHSDLESLSTEEKLEKYYAEYCSDADRKWMLDLTGDGQPELLVLSGSGELVEVNVYAVRANAVKRIFGDAAAECHSGQKALYLIDNMDGSFSLLSYMPSNWQGYRSISADWYTINNDGEWISRDYLYTDSDYDMYEDVRQFLWRMYPYSVNMEVLYDTIPEEEKDEWTSALASLSQDEVLSGTPDEDSELNQTSNSDAEDDWTLSEDWESESQDSGTEQLNNSSVEFVFQMPENIFWSIDDPYGSWQLRFRNEDDGCYMDLRSPDGMTFSSPCELDMGTSVDIDIDDYKLLEMNVMSFSQDFTGGDYNITYSPETSQIFVTTANGQWIELYFFDD